MRHMEYDDGRKIGKTISGIIILTLIAKVFGFFREIFLSYYFGATGISDAYLISLNIPGTLFQVVGVGLTTCFIPIFYGVKNQNHDTNKYTNKILTIVFSFSSFLIIIIWAFTPLVVKLFASGFEGETQFYAIWFTRIGMLGLFFSSMVYVYNSFLQANHFFVAQAFAAIPNSLFIILSIYLGSKLNLWCLSIGSMLAVGVQLLFLIPSMKKAGYHFQLRFDWQDAAVGQFFKMMGPVVIGVSVNEFNVLIDRTVASQVAVGGISALTYANSLIMFVQGGFVQPIATVFYPRITETISRKDYVAGNKIINHAISLMLGMLIPIMVGFILFGRAIVEILFGRGVFDETAVKLTSTAVLLYSLGICFIGLREFISRYYYAYGDSMTPMINTSIGVAVNIILNLVLSRRLGVGGLALATSLSAFVTTVLLIFHSGKKLISGKIKLDVVEIVKILLNSVVMGAICWVIYYVTAGMHDYCRLIISVMVGAFVYLLGAYCLKLQTYEFLISFLKGKK